MSKSSKKVPKKPKLFKGAQNYYPISELQTSHLFKEKTKKYIKKTQDDLNGMN